MKPIDFYFYFQQNLFPEAGLIYDYVFVKQASGVWSKWIDTVDKDEMTIKKDAKVYQYLFNKFDFLLVIYKIYDFQARIYSQGHKL